jgi:hypothetical protein
MSTSGPAGFAVGISQALLPAGGPKPGSVDTGAEQMADRQELLRNAISFLSDPSVSSRSHGILWDELIAS